MNNEEYKDITYEVKESKVKIKFLRSILVRKQEKKL